MDERALGKELVRICGKLARKGLIAATDGNVSCRVAENRLLITRSGVAKGEISVSDLLTVDGQGNVLFGEGRPSSEIRLHLLVYARRPDVRAVVHAHPAMLTALTLAGVEFDARVLPEVWLSIGPVPTAGYATPSTEEVPASVAPFVAEHQAILLERHGSLTLGKTLEEAYQRLEKLEHAAQTLFYARLLSGKNAVPLGPDELEKLDRIRGG